MGHTENKHNKYRSVWADNIIITFHSSLNLQLLIFTAFTGAPIQVKLDELLTDNTTYNQMYKI